MIYETIKRIEKEIETNVTDDKEKKELLDLIDNLKLEIESLKDTHGDTIRSITTFTEAGIFEGTREERDEELFQHAVKGMQLSVREFEVSHPKLTNIINAIGNTLNNIGI
ncbi:MAG TPA: DUF4404 family protein [Chitinispirillaceae bacterium]|nr:DUF4404 family protein [Chitinispirillaceae bacterium]